MKHSNHWIKAHRPWDGKPEHEMPNHYSCNQTKWPNGWCLGKLHQLLKTAASPAWWLWRSGAHRHLPDIPGGMHRILSASPRQQTHPVSVNRNFGMHPQVAKSNCWETQVVFHATFCDGNWDGLSMLWICFLFHFAEVGIFTSGMQPITSHQSTENLGFCCFLFKIKVSCNRTLHALPEPMYSSGRILEGLQSIICKYRFLMIRERKLQEIQILARKKQWFLGLRPCARPDSAASRSACNPWIPKSQILLANWQPKNGKHTTKIGI